MRWTAYIPMLVSVTFIPTLGLVIAGGQSIVEVILAGPDAITSSPLENVPADEAGAIATIVAAIETRVRDDATRTGMARRDAHPKAHGCVKAEFDVLPNLPDNLRQGVFASPRTFQAWIRFSNGSGSPQEDAIGDGRGMAIKLLDVHESPSGTQDFILINHPVFFVRNAADYVALQSGKPLGFFFPSWNPLSFRLHEGFIALSIAFQKVRNVLDIQYWSMTPYSFGAGACKFSARPSGIASTFVATETPDFLHDNLVAQLATRDASFDFMVQLQGPGMPIEDPTIVWSDRDAPFVPVATIRIPSQSFDQPAQREFCENLSFTPWHCVPAHRPLGGINRVRRVVYEHISKLRHDFNHTPREEPTTRVV